MLRFAKYDIRILSSFYFNPSLYNSFSFLALLYFYYATHSSPECAHVKPAAEKIL